MRNDENALTPAMLAEHKTIMLETRKRDGSWVATPVSVVVDGDDAFFRTWDTSGKAKRLRNFEVVRVAPCTLGGRVTGPRLAAHARQVHGREAERARRALASEYPLLHRYLVPWIHRIRRQATLHYVLRVDT